LEETLKAFADLVRQGKVRYLGCSNFPAWLLCKSLWISDVHNLSRFVCLQPRYNLIDRGIETEILPFCASEGIGVIPYSPLAGGFLTGKYKRGEEPARDTRFGRRKEFLKPPYWNDVNFDLIDSLANVAKEHGKSPAQLALAWLIDNPLVTAPIIGATKVSQLEETIAAADMTLSDAERQACDEMRGAGPDHLHPLAPPKRQT
jgi:aryl-alcohol dehydrogenase-like predicted oxidoreductase